MGTPGKWLKKKYEKVFKNSKNNIKNYKRSIKKSQKATKVIKGTKK